MFVFALATQKMGASSLVWHYVVVAAASSGIILNNFCPHFISWLDDDPCNVLLSMVRGKYVLTYKFKQVGIPCMTGGIDEMWKSFCLRKRNQ